MCGIDLSDQKCACGRYYQKDGFGIDEINMYPLNRYNEIYISSNATAHVKNSLQEYFKDYGVVRELNVVSYEEMHIENDKRFLVTRFVLLSKEVAKKYSEEVITLKAEEFYKLLEDWSVLMVVEIKEAVRKGKYTQGRMPQEIEQLLLECDVPEWYVESMKKIWYLLPKTHLIELLKREISKFVKATS